MLAIIPLWGIIASMSVLNNGLKFKLIISIGIILLAVAFSYILHFINANLSKSELASKDIFTIKQKLISEFDGAYPEQASPNGTVRTFKMTAAKSKVEIVPGYKTDVWAYNGQVPGPSFRIKLGETFRLEFKNMLDEPTTIHFHGVRVPNAMDGVPGVTQDPIPPGGSFVYEFTPKDPGTYWFHPHVRSFEQVERGLFGTLIVEDDTKELYDKDELWVMDDWRLTSDAQVFPNFMIMPDLMHDGRWGNVITVNGKPKGMIKVKAGERIRMRFVNSSNGRSYKLYFDNLPKENIKAIAVDGMYVKKVFNPNGFELAPGNRLDVDIKIPKNSDGKVFAIVDRFLNQENYLGEIVVDGAVTDDKDRTFPYPINPRIPDWNEAFDLPIDKLYVLDRRMVPRSQAVYKDEISSSNTGGMGMMGGMAVEWTINGKAYPDFDPVSLKFGEFNKIRFKNNSPNYHPMHLHGQFFKLVARNGKKVNEGFFRDTVLVAPKETVDIALVPLDKGRWLSHCHILEHADAGMMTVVEVE